MYRVVLDTCAMVPSRQRDFLLQLAIEGAYTPLWGSGILTELDYVLERIDEKRGRQPRLEYRQRLLAQMAHAFPGAQIAAPKDLTYSYDIDDPGDGHVAHAAIFGKADALITDDKRAGFTRSKDLKDAQIQIVSPARFAGNTAAAHPIAALRAVKAMAARMTSPSMTPGQVLYYLASTYGMTEVAEVLTPLLESDRPAG